MGWWRDDDPRRKEKKADKEKSLSRPRLSCGRLWGQFPSFLWVDLAITGSGEGVAARKRRIDFEMPFPRSLSTML